MKMAEGLPNVIQMKDSFSQLDHLLMVFEWKGPVSVYFLGGEKDQTSRGEE